MMGVLAKIINHMEAVTENEIAKDEPDHNLFDSSLLLQMANKLLIIVYKNGDDEVQDALAAPIDEVSRLARAMCQAQ